MKKILLIISLIFPSISLCPEVGMKELALCSLIPAAALGGHITATFSQALFHEGGHAVADRAFRGAWGRLHLGKTSDEDEIKAKALFAVGKILIYNKHLLKTAGYFEPADYNGPDASEELDKEKPKLPAATKFQRFLNNANGVLTGTLGGACLTYGACKMIQSLLSKNNSCISLDEQLFTLLNMTFFGTYALSSLIHIDQGMRSWIPLNRSDGHKMQLYFSEKYQPYYSYVACPAVASLAFGTYLGAKKALLGSDLSINQFDLLVATGLLARYSYEFRKEFKKFEKFKKDHHLR